MKCLLCQSDLSPTLYFHQLFLLAPQSQGLCPTCQSQFQAIKAPHCDRCYKPEIQGICSDCQLWEKEGIIVSHQAIFSYNTAMEDYFSRYKFMGDYRLRHAFNNYFKKEKNYTIVPIPVSSERFQERGFNQVIGLIEHLDFRSLLVKKERASQSTLNRAERLKNKNTFTLKAKVRVPQKILLVDDVYTTGRTIQHAVTVLKKAGAQEVKSFSLCR